ncbi:MAG: YcnI family copper-binding membrane protein [Sulfitobacter sp.]
MNVKTITSVVALVAISATASWSHATLEVQSAPVGSTYKGVMRIGHGCDGQPTQSVSIKIPEGVISVKPMPKAGWTVETTIADYAETYDYYGTPLSKGVREIIWKGTLDDAHYDEFVFRGSLVKSLEAGTVIYFPTIQTCADGSENWINIPAEGQDAHDIEGPAPGLMLTEAGHAHH